MERIRIKEAAEILGVSEQYVRIGIQRGWLPIGSCVKVHSKWCYHIPKERFEAYLRGIDLIDFYMKKQPRLEEVEMCKSEDE